MSVSNGKPRLKISESISKVTIPHKKQVYRLRNSAGELIGADAIAMRDETEVNRIYDPQEPLKSLLIESFTMEPLLHPVMENGKRIGEKRSLKEIAQYSVKCLESLPLEYKRFRNPHIYKVGISSKLNAEREKLLQKYKGQS